MRLSIPGGARPAWYDRNPIIEVSLAVGTMSENTGATVFQSFTVPTGKKAFLNGLQATVIGEVLATTVADNDLATVIQSVTANFLRAALHSDSYTRGQIHDVELQPQAILNAGQVLSAVRQFQGSAAGAGIVNFLGSRFLTEFDA